MPPTSPTRRQNKSMRCSNPREAFGSGIPSPKIKSPNWRSDMASCSPSSSAASSPSCSKDASPLARDTTESTSSLDGTSNSNQDQNQATSGVLCTDRVDAAQSSSICEPTSHLEAAKNDIFQDSIRVVVRIRPPYQQQNQQQQPFPSECMEIFPDQKGLTLAPDSFHQKHFAFDRVFPCTTSQQEVFEHGGQVAVEKMVAGYNGSIFAYGQTGSGKTFTMLGPNESSADLKASQQRGLMPRIFDRLFDRLACMSTQKAQKGYEYACICSYLEIYHEKIYDLLDENDGTSGAAPLPKSLREDPTKEVYVESLREVQVRDSQEAIELLHIGAKSRRVAATELNRESSRSHAVFTIKLIQKERSENGNLVTKRSNLHLVDLAGSEKQSQTKAQGDRLKEAAQINKSLSALGNVIMCLVDVANGLKRHVPYRDSKLTFYLRDSLGGNAITTIVATIAAEERFFKETLSTLKFAQRAKYMKNCAVINEEVANPVVPLLQQEICMLRNELEKLKIEASLSKRSPTAKNGICTANSRWREGFNDKLNQLVAELRENETLKDPNEDHGNNDLQSRCQRLELLLYRTICAVEEPSVRPDMLGGGISLSEPKLRQTASGSENQPENTTNTSTDSQLRWENTALRQEIKALLSTKQSASCTAGADSMHPAKLEEEPTVPQSKEQERMVPILEAYRSFTEYLNSSAEEKKRILYTEELLSPTCSTCEDFSSVQTEQSEPSDSSSSVQVICDEEIQRIGETTKRMERVFELVSRFEKSQLILQDELETASTALKFAEFQLQQQKTSAMEDTKRQLAELTEHYEAQLGSSKREVEMMKEELGTQTILANERCRLAEGILHKRLEKMLAEKIQLEISLESMKQKANDWEQRVAKVEGEKELQLELWQDERQQADQVHQKEIDQVKRTLGDEYQALLDAARIEMDKQLQIQSQRSTDMLLEIEKCHARENDLKRNWEQEMNRIQKIVEESKLREDSMLKRIQELETKLVESTLTSSCSVNNATSSSSPTRFCVFPASSAFRSSCVVKTDDEGPSRTGSTTSGALGSVGGSSNGTRTNSLAQCQSHAQKLLDAALADNAELLETIRKLEHKVSERGEASAQKEMEDRLLRLQTENSSLKRLLYDKKMVQAPLNSVMKQNEEIKRLAAERVALNSRLQVTQQRMKNLEAELNRSREMFS